MCTNQCLYTSFIFEMYVIIEQGNNKLIKIVSKYIYNITTYFCSKQKLLFW